MNNPYRGGTADWWYSGDRADLWVEYKYIDRIPVRASVLPDLSELQKDWLAGRVRENRNVAVIVGCPEGGVIYLNGEWLVELSPNVFRERICSQNQLARWIMAQTISEGVDNHPQATERSKGRKSGSQDGSSS